METYGIFVIVAILCGIVSAAMANSKRRPPVLWFFLGALFNVFILVGMGLLFTRKTAPVRR
jgi:sugar phosphate permease